jgi:hypothetical protein
VLGSVLQLIEGGSDVPGGRHGSCHRILSQRTLERVQDRRWH